MLETIIYYGTPAYGHIHPSLPIVRELVNKGYRVVYYATPQFMEVIVKQGAEFCEYPADISGIDLTIASNIPKFYNVLLQYTWIMLPKLLEQLNQLDPVLILHDSVAPWGRIVARMLKVKAICIYTILAIPRLWSSMMLSYSKHFYACIPSFINEVSSIFKTKHQLKKHYPNQNYGLLPMLMNKEPFNILTYSKEMGSKLKGLNNSYFFTGPLSIWREELPQQAINKEDLIYVSLGTIFNASMQFYESLIKSFSRSSFRIVISCGSIVNKLKGNLPPNIEAYAFVDQKEMLLKAKLFICAGGMNSIQEAIYYQVPLLLYPMQQEQQMNAEVIEQLGFGKIGTSLTKMEKEATELIDNKSGNEEVRKRMCKSYLFEVIKQIEEYRGKY